MCQVPYYLEEHYEILYQGLDPESKGWYLLNCIRCDKLSTAVTTVRAHPDNYKKDFDKVITFLTQCIDKRAPTPSVKVASVGQTRSAKWQKTSANQGTFKGKIELKKYSREEYDSMLTTQCQKYELQKIGGQSGHAKSKNSTNENLFADGKLKANNRNNWALDRKGSDSVTSSKPKVKLDSYADMCVVGDNHLVIHGNNGPVNVYSYNPKYRHKIPR